MKLHNPLTGVQISVDDDEGERLLAGGGWASGDTPDDWKAPKPGETPDTTTTAATDTTTTAAKSKPAPKSDNG